MHEVLQICDDRRALAVQAAAAAIDAIKQRLANTADEGTVNVAIAGGFIGTDVMTEFLPYAEEIEWSRVCFWWVDERYVQYDDPQRNDFFVIENVLKHLPGARWISMPDENGDEIEVAARRAMTNALEYLDDKNFDLALLGMGPDGHIASLFPHHEWAEYGQYSPGILVVKNSPKPPAQRLTFSMQVITDSYFIILAAAGQEKADALRHVLDGADPSQWPAAVLLQPDVVNRVRLFIDEEANPASL